MWRQLGDRKHAMCNLMGRCVLYPSATTNFPTSHWYYEASHLAASFAVCCQYSMQHSQCLVHCAPCHDKGCNLGCCLKLRYSLLCFLEGERKPWSAGSCCHDVWELSAAPSYLQWSISSSQLKELFACDKLSKTYFPLEIMSPYNHGSFESFQVPLVHLWRQSMPLLSRNCPLNRCCCG